MKGRHRSSSRASSSGGGQPIGPIVGTPPPGAMLPEAASHNNNKHRLTAPFSSRKSDKPRSKWHFGIRSKCPVWEVMLEIYRSLQNVGMVMNGHWRFSFFLVRENGLIFVDIGMASG